MFTPNAPYVCLQFIKNSSPAELKELVLSLRFIYLFDRCAHYAIYDGHGGQLAAEYAQKHLHPNVLSAGLPRELVCLLGLI